MPAKTKQEINEEVTKLASLVGNLKVSMFGEDHNEAVKVQIDALTGVTDSDEIDEYEANGGMTESAIQSARDAIEWMEGDSDVVSLAAEWETLKR